MADCYYKIKGASKADMEVLLADNMIRQVKMLNNDYAMIPNIFLGEGEIKEITVSPLEIVHFLNKLHGGALYEVREITESLDRLYHAKLHYKEFGVVGTANLLPRAKYTRTEIDEQGRKVTTTEYYGGVPTNADVVHKFATVFDRFEYE